MAGNNGTAWDNMNFLERMYVSSYPNVASFLMTAPYRGENDPAGNKLSAALEANNNGFCARLNQAMADPEIRERTAALPPDVMAQHVDRMIANPENLPALLDEVAPKPETVKTDQQSRARPAFTTAATGFFADPEPASEIAASSLGQPSLSEQFAIHATQPLLPLTPEGMMPVVQAMTPETPQAAATLARAAASQNPDTPFQGMRMQEMMQGFQNMFNGPGFDGLKNMFGDLGNHLSGILGALGNVLKSVLGTVTEKLQGFSASPRMIVSNQPGGSTPMANDLDKLNGQKPQTLAFTQNGQQAPAPTAQTPKPPEQEKPQLASTGAAAPGMT